MSILRLLFSFIKVGIIGFGGGSALIPIVRSELVLARGVMSDEDYLRHTVVANITPGALPVKLGATCGFQLAGIPGSLLGAYAVVAPGVVGTVAIIALFSFLGDRAIHYLNYAGVGITIFIVFLLMHYVWKTTEDGDVRINRPICLAAFFATCGREVREAAELLFGLSPDTLGVPLLNISMIHVMIAAIYLIYVFQLPVPAGRKWIGAAIAAAYVLACGGMIRATPCAGAIYWICLAALAVSVVLFHFGHPRKTGEKGMGLNRRILGAVVLFLAVAAAVAAACMEENAIPFSGKISFLANILVSALTSFGGGEAYVAVADSIFVQGGHVGADIFYGRIIPVANALPGPILIKVAAAIGFVWGETNVSTEYGVLMAAACMAVTTGACCGLALLVLNFYETLSHSSFVVSLKKYILPVICGTLISTSLSMLVESMKIMGEYAYNPALVLGIMLAGVALTFYIAHRWKIHDILLLGAWVGAGLLAMAVF